MRAARWVFLVAVSAALTASSASDLRAQEPTTGTPGEPSCQARFEQMIEEGVLELDFQAFDQDMDGGWRPLAGAGCFELAGELLDRYAQTHADHAMHWLTRFHAGQMYAMAGETNMAIPRFQDGRRPAAGNAAWNLYVDATLAFLRGEREEMERLRDELAELGTSEQPAMNLNVVDRMLDHFGESYMYAYSGGRMGG